MSTFLKNYFLSDGKKTFFSTEDSLVGDTLIHLPTKGDVNLISDFYNYSMFDLPCVNYYKSIFGVPREFRIIPKKDYQNEPDRLFLTSFYDPNACWVAGKSVLNASPNAFAILNDKFLFQNEAFQVLGENFTTKPRNIQKGAGIHKVFDIVKSELKSKDQLIIKICSPEYILIGAAKGVVLVDRNNYEIEIVRVLEAHDVLHDNLVLADLLIEDFFECDFSPSVNFFIDNEDVVFLSSNIQFLDNRRYQGATNMWPNDKQLQDSRNIVEEVAIKMACHCQKIGARGFLGFDFLVDIVRGCIKIIECNYRRGGASNPQLMTQRAAEFRLDTNWANWLMIQRIRFDSKCKNFDQLLDILDSENMLFKKNSDLDKISFLPMNALGRERFHLLCFWDKKLPLNDKKKILINQIWNELGDNRSLENNNQHGIFNVLGYK